MKYCFHTLEKDVSLSLLEDPLPLLSDRAKALIAREWNQSLARGAHLFEGEIFALSSLSPHRIEGRFIPYSWALALRAYREVRAEISLQPLGVTGLTLCGTQTLIGERSSTAAIAPLHYECIPAGAIDRHALCDGFLSWERALAQELLEESGIDSFLSITPLFLAQESEGRGCDLVASIRLSTISSLHPCDEHHSLRWIQRDAKELLKELPWEALSKKILQEFFFAPISNF